MIFGNLNKIDLSTTFYERMIAKGSLYVDKTRFIENFLNAASQVMLITRQGRLGKSLNMDTLRCILSSQVDFRHLFEGTYIKTSPVWEMAHSAPVFVYDFKTLSSENYKKEIYENVVTQAYALARPGDLADVARRLLEQLINNEVDFAKSFFKLTEFAYHITGKKSYVFIDEYDSSLINCFGTGRYEEIRRFLTDLIAAVMKGNPYLEKGLITGVMRISYVSLFNGLNNIETFDMFNDDVYTDNYGLTEVEASALCELAGKNLDDVRAWYNGVRVCGKAIYSTYSTMYYLAKDVFGCYWGRSGNLEMIMEMFTDKRRDISTLSIPNTELRMVWQQFILRQYYPSHPKLRTIFDNAFDKDEFAYDLEYFLNDRLSYHDLAVFQGEDPGSVHERISTSSYWASCQPTMTRTINLQAKSLKEYREKFSPS